MTGNKKRWTEIEKHFLSTNAATMRDTDIANHLKKSLKSVREMRRRMGMVKLSGRGRVQLKDGGTVVAIN